MDKVKQVSEHVNMILRYIPYIQTNFVMGLDGDMGPEPFELTKKFIDLSPGAFPAYSLLSAFGRAAPMNLDYQRAGRVLPFPFHFLNNNHAMNVRPKNYTWPEFYKHLVDVTRYSFSWKAIGRRIPATPTMIPKWMNVVRAVSSEGFGRIRYHETIKGLLETDRSVRRYMEGETDQSAGVLCLPDSARASDQRTISCRRGRWSMIPTPTCTPRPSPPWSKRCSSAVRWFTDASGLRPGVRTPFRTPSRSPPRNSKCSSPISRSPSGVCALARCQSSSCWPTVVAGSQTPGSIAGYRSANSGRSRASRMLCCTEPPMTAVIDLTFLVASNGRQIRRSARVGQRRVTGLPDHVNGGEFICPAGAVAKW